MKRDASASEQEEETAKETEGGTGLLRLAIRLSHVLVTQQQRLMG